jgi:hypothetical protein
MNKDMKDENNCIVQVIPEAVGSCTADKEIGC